MISASVGTVTIVGTAAMTHSHRHAEPKLEGEGHDDYDLRTWRSKLNTDVRNGKATVVIPAHAINQCLTSAAKYSKRQIPGQGRATWSAKFMAGIALMDNPALNIDPATVNFIEISANADGVRGSGKRVQRRFPIMPPGWKATFDVYILDPIITEQVFREMVQLAGMFVGLGQFRPEKGGTNGRFTLNKLVWADNRQLAA